MPEAMSRSQTAAACLAAATIAVGGCGESKPVRTAQPVVRIALDEYRIIPQNISARPGRLKIDVRNVGRLTHNLAIQRPPRHVGDKPEDVPGGRVQSMQPGEVAAPIKVTLAPGTYRLVCTIANHDDLGQYGKLVIEGPPL
jgi:hypothetical protein